MGILPFSLSVFQFRPFRLHWRKAQELSFLNALGIPNQMAVLESGPATQPPLTVPGTPFPKLLPPYQQGREASSYKWGPTRWPPISRSVRPRSTVLMFSLYQEKNEMGWGEPHCRGGMSGSWYDTPTPLSCAYLCKRGCYTQVTSEPHQNK